MTRDEVQAHLKRANVHGEWEHVLTKDLCTALIDSMDRVEELETARKLAYACHERMTSLRDGAMMRLIAGESARAQVQREVEDTFELVRLLSPPAEPNNPSPPKAGEYGDAAPGSMVLTHSPPPDIAGLVRGLEDAAVALLTLGGKDYSDSVKAIDEAAAALQRGDEGLEMAARHCEDKALKGTKP